MSREIPVSNSIVQFCHCALCLTELKAAGMLQSPRDYAQLEVGFTKLGVQVWCKRHEVNVFHIDFEGQKHPANLTIEGKDGMTH